MNKDKFKELDTALCEAYRLADELMADCPEMKKVRRKIELTMSAAIKLSQKDEPEVPRLGNIQREVYQALMEHGRWHSGCGWIWDNYSTTTRLLESLVKRGVAYRVQGTRTGAFANDVTYFPIINDSLDAAFRPAHYAQHWDRYVERARANQERFLRSL